MSAEPGLCRLLHLPVVYAGSEHRNPLVSAALSVGVKLPPRFKMKKYLAVCEEAGSAGLHSEQTTERETLGLHPRIDCVTRRAEGRTGPWRWPGRRCDPLGQVLRRPRRGRWDLGRLDAESFESAAARAKPCT